MEYKCPECGSVEGFHQIPEKYPDVENNAGLYACEDCGRKSTNGDLDRAFIRANPLLLMDDEEDDDSPDYTDTRRPRR